MQIALAFTAILLYFLFFARKAASATFSPDDMMNLAGYWRRGWWPTVVDNLFFWSSAYRPMGGLFYLPLFKFFGLNPLPYRLIALAFLFAGAWLSYLVAYLLTQSRSPALVTAILCCAHAKMVDAYYSDATIYDILARFFSMLVLFLYIRIRQQNKIPTLPQTLAILLAFAAALDSKEISVIIAGSVLTYEIFFHGWPRRWQWLNEEGLVPALLIVCVLGYTLGKFYGPHPLADTQNYRMVFSLSRYLDTNIAYTGSFFYGFVHTRLALLLIGLVLLALLFQPNRILRWCAFYALTATLPISFVPTRGGSSLLVPFFGWALLLPTAISVLCKQWKPGANIALALLCIIFIQRTVRFWQPAPFTDSQQKTWHAITQLEDLHYQPKPRAKVMILDDPWPGWDMIFISELVWNDPTLDIYLSSKIPSLASPEELAKMQAVLKFAPDGTLQIIRE